MNAFWTTILLATTLGGSTYAADWPAEDLWYKCKACHGMDGKGNTKIGVKEKIPDLTSPTWQAKMSDEEIRKVISEGSAKSSKMKAYKEIFSQAEIDSLVPYVRSLNAK
jgi:cytochrome c6